MGGARDAAAAACPGARAQERDCPVEMLEVMDKVVDFAWEPRGNRFGMILGDGPLKFTIRFYAMGGAGEKLSLLYQIPDAKQANRLVWSPLGNNVVLAGLNVRCVCCVARAACAFFGETCGGRGGRRCRI